MAEEKATLSSFQAEVGRLVELFERNRAHFSEKGYDEASLRNEFLNPFFRALGWDVENQAGHIPSQREVELESRTEISGRQKRADFLFRVGGRERFVCEAKKPGGVPTPSAAFQAKRYAWNKNLPLALLTDFVSWRLYLVGSKPHPDEPDLGLWKSWQFRELPLAADEIWKLLSRDSVAGGVIEREIEALPMRPSGKGRAQQQWLIKPDRTRALDTDFLNFLDDARRELASDLLKHNDRADLLEGTKLNEAVQHIIDRVLFLRICEDREIDTGKRLTSFLRGGREGGAWRKPRQPALLASEAQATYGTDAQPKAPAPEGAIWRSLARHFGELDRRPPTQVPFFNGNLFKEHFCEELIVGDEWLGRFIAELSDEESPYLFIYIPVEILGTIYERFLGKVVRPQGRGATIEEKPDVRKAGGVYYTPRYIVDYIVEQTVGKLLEGRTPEASLKLKILDPACGSGSFLIRAFERVCEHWQEWLTRNPQKRRRAWCWTDPATNDVHLTSALKRRILTSTIHGVDLDAAAVEVTQLSLYLKMLEDENRTTLQRERELFGGDEPILPPLENNIKNGNSLIASDFSMIPEDLVRVHAFDWPVQFKEIMQNGGFDAIIGNPPYILLQTMEERTVFSYISGKYRAAKYKIDTYQVFMERALSLIKEQGLFGFITPNSFLRNKHAIELRSLILKTTEVAALRTFYYPVFKGASVDTCILIARKVGHPNPVTRITVMSSETPSQASTLTVQQQRWQSHPQKNFFMPGPGATDELVEKIRNRSDSLGEVATAYFGIQTFDRDKYVTERKRLKVHKPIIDGGNIQRYDLLPGSEFVDFRPSAIKSGGNAQVYENERIGVRQIGKTPIGTIIPAGIYSLNTIYNIYFIKPTRLSLRFVLALISSSTGRWYWEHCFFDQKETFPKVKKDSLLSFPIPRLDSGKAEDYEHHDRIVSLVDKMRCLMPGLRMAKSESEKQTLQNAVDATDREIDQLVYELYGLTKEEIALVEGGR